MTYYNSLDYSEQQEVLKELDEEGFSDLEIDQVMKGVYCASCFMIYYNCLCYHEED